MKKNEIIIDSHDIEYLLEILDFFQQTMFNKNCNHTNLLIKKIKVLQDIVMEHFNEIHI